MQKIVGNRHETILETMTAAEVGLRPPTDEVPLSCGRPSRSPLPHAAKPVSRRWQQPQPGAIALQASR
jgi:hypothetical protein